MSFEYRATPCLRTLPAEPTAIAPLTLMEKLAGFNARQPGFSTIDFCDGKSVGPVTRSGEGAAMSSAWKIMFLEAVEQKHASHVSA